MHARIGTFEVTPEGLSAVVTFFRDRIVPAFSKHEGFIGYEAYVDSERGLFVGISLWATRAAVEASGATARLVLAEAAGLGVTTVREPQILELAFDTRSQP